MRIRDKKWEDYDISWNRYKELLFFCRQYPEKKRRIGYGLKAVENDGMPHGTSVGKPTEASAIENAELQRDIDLIESAAKSANPVIWESILQSVVCGTSYEHLGDVPVCRRDFYGYRRMFFANLDREKRKLDHK